MIFEILFFTNDNTYWNGIIWGICSSNFNWLINSCWLVSERTNWVNVSLLIKILFKLLTSVSIVFFLSNDNYEQSGDSLWRLESWDECSDSVNIIESNVGYYLMLDVLNIFLTILKFCETICWVSILLNFKLRRSFRIKTFYMLVGGSS